MFQLGSRIFAKKIKAMVKKYNDVKEKKLKLELESKKQ
jgi:hypothetical protein